MYDDEENFDKAFQDHDNIDDDSFNSKRKRIPSLFTDKHCHSVKRYSHNTNLGKGNSKKNKKQNKSYNKPYKLTFYSSGDTGSNIRDAITGEYSKYIVGSKNQELFFKVIVATGESTHVPMHLFYASPEQYEEHQKCVIDEIIRQEWYYRYNTRTN